MTAVREGLSNQEAAERRRWLPQIVHLPEVAEVVTESEEAAIGEHDVLLMPVPTEGDPNCYAAIYQQAMLHGAEVRHDDLGELVQPGREPERMKHFGAYVAGIYIKAE